MTHFRQPRRAFLQTGIAGFCATILASLPKISFAKPNSSDGKGIVVHEDEGIHILTRRKVPINVKISKAKDGIDSISFCTEEMIPGRKMRIHKRLNHEMNLFLYTRGKAHLH